MFAFPSWSVLRKDTTEVLDTEIYVQKSSHNGFKSIILKNYWRLVTQYHIKQQKVGFIFAIISHIWNSPFTAMSQYPSGPKLQANSIWLRFSNDIVKLELLDICRYPQKISATQLECFNFWCLLLCYSAICNIKHSNRRSVNIFSF